MSQPLRQDLLATGHYAVRAMSVALTGGAIALAVLPHAAPSIEPAPAVAPELAEAVPAPVVVHEPPAPKPVLLPGGEFAFVFEAGGGVYAKLVSLDPDDLPPHGKIRVVKDDYIDVAIASVKPADVPGRFAEWLGHSLVVDGTCTAKVTGFAIVSRVNGDASWADMSPGATVGDKLFTVGSRELVAVLDRCTGTYARDARLPPIVVPERVAAPALETKAEALLIASSVSQQIDDGWHTAYHREGHWWEDHESTITTEVLRHPKTGVTWISVFAHRLRECGDPDVNAWGLFRVESDGSFTAVQLRQVGEVDTIDELIDVDGDGNFEVIGTPWLGPARELSTAGGEHLHGMGVQFLGCPC